MMKLILALPAVGLLFSGLTFMPKTEINIPATPGTPESPEVPSIWVNKSDCFKNETFELHFAQPHGSNMGVIDPDGNFFYLVFPEAGSVGELKPLVSSEAFESMNSLLISPSSLTADPYTYGVMENKPVFTKTGAYRFILGDNLHVHDESALNLVTVHYQHSDRPEIRH